MKMDRPLQDSYILFAKVINAEEPCESKITNLVGILIFIICTNAAEPESCAFQKYDSE